MSGAVKATLITGGVTFVGYVLMRTLTPDKDTMMKRLPSDMVTEKRLQEISLENERIFSTMKKSMHSNDPIWKLPGNNN